MTIEERHELLLDAIRDMLNFATGWTGVKAPGRRLELISKIGNDALAWDHAASLEKKQDRQESKEKARRILQENNLPIPPDLEKK